MTGVAVTVALVAVAVAVVAVGDAFTSRMLVKTLLREHAALLDRIQAPEVVSATAVRRLGGDREPAKPRKYARTLSGVRVPQIPSDEE